MSRLIKSQFTNRNDREKFSISVNTVRDLLEDSIETVDPSVSLRAQKVIHNAENEAKELIQRSHQQLDEVLRSIDQERAAWQEERELIIEQAKQEGYAEGLELGRQEAERMHVEFIEESRKIVTLAKQDYEDKVQSAEETILTLSVKLAEKILASEIDQSQERFTEIIKKALKEVKEYVDIKIHVHPINYQLLLSQKTELTLLITNESDLLIYADEEMDEKSCYIESPFGRIDASIDTQLQQLKDQLLLILRED
ncbi:flagellar assembly protein FliH [Metabacillus herbersteinensis]|uniref:flagellar assembly protein FliH n=1 Tax=Metabacillus herbersteinensis TaxID=283816 RepID=UPI00366F5BE7